MKRSISVLLAAISVASVTAKADPPASSAYEALQSNGGGLGTTNSDVQPAAQPGTAKPATPNAPDSQPAPTPAFVAHGGAFMYQPRPDGTIGKESDNEADAEKYDYGQLREGESVQVLGTVAPGDPGYANLKDWVKVRVNRREADGSPTEAWVPKSSVQTTSAGLNLPPAYTKMEPDACRDAFIKALKTYVGVPYKWGGTSKSGVDCSGLVVAGMMDAHCTTEAPPRTANAQQSKADKVSGGPDALPTGALIFVGSPAHHVFVFLGANDKDKPGGIIEAAHTGTNVSLNNYRAGTDSGDLLPKLGEQGK